MEKITAVFVRAALVCCLITGGIAFAEERLKLQPFGEVHVFKPTGATKGFIIFISGDGGWNQGVADMARELLPQGYWVAGVDIKTYFKHVAAGRSRCIYSPGDFENLSKHLQKKYAFKTYLRPALVGYSSGATLAYASLAQAPENTFSGAVSLGFCPDLNAHKPLCKNAALTSKALPKNKGFLLNPSKREMPDWFVLNGEKDLVCDFAAAKVFAATVKDAHFVPLPQVGHGYSVYKNWMPKLKDALSEVFATDNRKDESHPEVGDLPLVVIEPSKKPTDYFVLFLSGDGGWAGVDKSIADELVKEGIPVVGLNSLKYFWDAKSPTILAQDIERMIVAYAKKFDLAKVKLVGYSFGADVLPFAFDKLSEKSKALIVGVTLLGLSHTTDFEFHLDDWLYNSDDDLKTVPEIKKMAKFKPLCIYGEEESEPACPAAGTAVRSVSVPGGHHFGGDYKKVADLILQSSI